MTRSRQVTLRHQFSRFRLGLVTLQRAEETAIWKWCAQIHGAVLHVFVSNGTQWCSVSRQKWAYRLNENILKWTLVIIPCGAIIFWHKSDNFCQTHNEENLSSNQWPLSILWFTVYRSRIGIDGNTGTF